MSEEDRIRYLEKIIPNRVLAKNEDLKNFEMVECKASSCKSFDGFLSLTYLFRLELEENTTKR